MNVSRQYLRGKSKKTQQHNDISRSPNNNHSTPLLCDRKLCRIDDVTSRRDFCCVHFSSPATITNTQNVYTFGFYAVSDVHGCVCACVWANIFIGIRLWLRWLCVRETEVSQHSHPNGLKCFQMDQQRKNCLVNVSANANYNGNLKHIKLSAESYCQCSFFSTFSEGTSLANSHSCLARKENATEFLFSWRKQTNQSINLLRIP